MYCMHYSPFLLKKNLMISTGKVCIRVLGIHITYGIMYSIFIVYVYGYLIFKKIIKGKTASLGLLNSISLVGR